MSRIFISYRRGVCFVYAERLYYRLTSLPRRINVFWDHEKISVGENFQEKFKSELRRSTIFVPLISRSTLISFKNTGEEDNLLLEWDMALEKYQNGELEIIPVFIVEPGEIKFDWDIDLPDERAKDCRKSSKEIWEVFRYLNGKVVNFSYEDLVSVLVNNIAEKCPSSHEQGESENVEEKIVSEEFSTPRHCIGREDSLREISNALHNKKTSSAIFIFGGPGIGKTTIVFTYVSKLQTEPVISYTHILLINFTSESTFGKSIYEISRLLGIEEYDYASTRQKVLAWLSSYRKYLLVLECADNVNFVRRCLGGIKKFAGHVIVVSRDPAIEEHIILGMDDANIKSHIVKVWKDKQPAREYVEKRLKSRPMRYNYERAALESILDRIGGYPIVVEQMCSFMAETISFSFFEYNRRLQVGDEKLLNHFPENAFNIDSRPFYSTFELTLNFFIEDKMNATCAVVGALSSVANTKIPIHTYLKRYLALVGYGSSDIGEAIYPLIRRSLISVDSKFQFVSVHRVTQDVMRIAVTAKWSELKRGIRLRSISGRNATSSATFSYWQKTALMVINNLFQEALNSEVERTRVRSAKVLLPHILVLSSTLEANTMLLSLAERGGDFAKSIGYYGIAKALYSAALAILKSFGSDGITKLINKIGGIARIEGNFVEAKNRYLESLNIAQTKYETEHHLEVASAKNNLGLIADLQGDYETAEKLFRESLLSFEIAHGTSDHEDVAATINNLALVLCRQGKLEEAENMCSMSVWIKVNVLGTDEHPSVAKTLNNLGMIEHKRGNFIQAKNYVTMSLSIYEKTTEHFEMVKTLHNLGSIAREEGNEEEATTWFEKSSQLLISTRNESNNADYLQLQKMLYDKLNDGSLISDYDVPGPIRTLSSSIFSARESINGSSPPLPSPINDAIYNTPNFTISPSGSPHPHHSHLIDLIGNALNLQNPYHHDDSPINSINSDEIASPSNYELTPTNNLQREDTYDSFNSSRTDSSHLIPLDVLRRIRNLDLGASDTFSSTNSGSYRRIPVFVPMTEADYIKEGSSLEDLSSSAINEDQKRDPEDQNEEDDTSEGSNENIENDENFNDNEVPPVVEDTQFEPNVISDSMTVGPLIGSESSPAGNVQQQRRTMSWRFPRLRRVSTRRKKKCKIL